MKTKRKSSHTCKPTFTCEFRNYFIQEWKYITEKLKESGKDLKIPLIPDDGRFADEQI